MLLLLVLVLIAEARSSLYEKRSADIYQTYTGNGDSPPWPSMDSWVSTFNTMFTNNMLIMNASCTQWGAPNNSPQEIEDIQNGVQQIASETNVDPRFILAIMLQESLGCVRAPTTNGGVTNPGLMQSHDGSGSCNNNGNVQTPCPEEEIVQMISDGVAGTSSGDGLMQCLTEAGTSDVSKYYRAARIYNSGSIAASGDLGAGVATHCYASDIANRLTGWILAENTCTLDSQSSSTANVPSTPNNVTSSYGIGPGTPTNCSTYYTVGAGDTCDSVAERFNITFLQLQTLNPGINARCSNLWLGYDYCVAL